VPPFTVSVSDGPGEVVEPAGGSLLICGPRGSASEPVPGSVVPGVVVPSGVAVPGPWSQGW